MPNDDLGTFPLPPAPNVADGEVGPAPVTSPVIPATPFEPTPDEIPSAPIEPLPQSEPTQPPVSVATPATLPPKSASPIVPIIIVVLILVAGIGLAAAAFLAAQTAKLKTQLSEITNTLQKQETTLTPTPSPTEYVVPTPITATPSATPTASSALKIAIDHSPNAQLILIKVDNATDATTSVTKYFFREDLTTKKYFYIAITGKGSPEIIDKQIYVTPDDNIPSLNDAVLSNKLGLELDEAIRISYTQCTDQKACIEAPIKAQYIRTGTGIIWQLSLYTNGISGTPLMIQINAQTKAILYQSPEFANK